MSPSSNINAEEVDFLAALDRSTLLEFAALLRLPPSSFIAHPNATASLPQPWLDTQRTTLETTLSPELLATPRRGGVIKHTLGRLLRTPTGSSSSSTTTTNPSDNDAKNGSLCPSHSLLNPHLITHCLALLRAEISFRCDVLRSYVYRVRLPSPSPNLTPDEQATLDEVHRLRELVYTLSGLATLWLRPDAFEAYFGSASAPQPRHRFERVRSGCGACVLSVVGGREEALAALRANMLGRAKGRVPRLARLVEAWMEIAGRGEEKRMRGESKRLAAEVTRVREWMEKLKVERRARKGKGEGGGKKKTGRSRHVGGMPEGTRVVEGMPMPQVRLDGERERRRHGEDRNDCQFPFGGMDGMADFAQQRPPGGRSEAWSSSVLSSGSAEEVDADNNGEFAPARQYWPHSPRTATQGTPVQESVYGTSPSHARGPNGDRPSSTLSTMLQPTVYAADGESVRIFLDQSTFHHAPPPLAPQRHHRQSEQSAATNWEDLYREKKGNKRH